MASRNTPPGQSARKSKSSRRWRIPRFVWYFMLAGAVVMGLWFVWIDYQIRRDFEALQWALPARIYSRPLELYAGAHVDVAALTDYVQRLGYRRSTRLEGPGEYQISDDRVRLRTRGFQFWDGAEPSAYVDLTIHNHYVTALQGEGGGELPLVRLEPVEIEQVNPTTGEDRLPVSLAEVPPALVDAVISIEDQRFYSHHGIDPKGIARAMWANVKAGGIVQGGSTLTQQLIKNLYLDRQQTLRRKAEEALMAVALELHFSKDEILTAYLNEIFLGQDGNRAIHGFALAAQHYFGRPLNELRLDELATLAGVGRGASYYNPLRYPERAVERRNVVLTRMHERGNITDEQFEQARKAKMQVREKTVARTGYPAFMQLVYENLSRDYDSDALRTEGLKIFTTLDVSMQGVVEAKLDGAVKNIERASAKNNPLETAVVITDANTGEVRALAGGRHRGYNGFNRALQARRPIGSLVKPAVYLTALESGKFNLASVLSDREIELKQPNGDVWRPGNYDHEVNGDVYLFDALERSLNLATVDLGMQVGVDNVIGTLGRLGFSGKANPYPSLLLGAVDMTPIEVAQIYQTLASSGFRSPLRAVEAVTTSSGEPLAFYGIETKQVADPTAVFLLEHAMQGVFERGTARYAANTLGANMPLAGKTGTTNDLRDSWFAGYGNDLVGVVWVGHDNNAETGLTGATGALIIWSELMKALDVQPRDALAPDNIVWDQVPMRAVRDTSQRDCGDTLSLPFADEHMADVGISCEVNDSFFERVLDRFRGFGQ